MKTNSFKSGLLSTVKGTGCVLHLAVQTTTNAAFILGTAACNKIANAEGYLVERINGTPQEETAGLRYEYTQAKMVKAGVIAEKYINKFNQFNHKVDDIMVDAIDKIKHTIVPPAEDPHQDTLEFQLAVARSRRDKIINNEPYQNGNETILIVDEKEKARLINYYNKEIGRIKQAIKLPNLSPDQAFS